MGRLGLRSRLLPLLAVHLVVAVGGGLEAQEVGGEVEDRTAALLVGVGNSFGIMGGQAAVYVGDHLAAFAGLGYSPAVFENNPSGLAPAAGIRGFLQDRTSRGRGFFEFSWTQIRSEGWTECTLGAGGSCRSGGSRSYGPGFQAGYEHATEAGFALLISAGGGYPLVSSGTGEREWGHGSSRAVGLLFSLGIGYTFP